MGGRGGILDRLGSKGAGREPARVGRGAGAACDLCACACMAAPCCASRMSLDCGCCACPPFRLCTGHACLGGLLSSLLSSAFYNHG